MNPYTLSVTDKQIKFTIEFKRFLLDELAKPGVSYKQAFRNAGYDPNILGRSRILSVVCSVRKEAASPKGLRETGPSKVRLAEQDLSKRQMRASIKELQNELVRTQQELEFVKKILQLPPEDEGTP